MLLLFVQLVSHINNPRVSILGFYKKINFLPFMVHLHEPIAPLHTIRDLHGIGDEGLKTLLSPMIRQPRISNRLLD